jgi:serine/threonine-protein kinase
MNKMPIRREHEHVTVAIGSSGPAGSRLATPSAATLSPEVRRTLQRRLAGAALLYACAYFIAYGQERIRILVNHVPGHEAIHDVIAGVSVALALFVFAIARKGKLPPVSFSTIALAFEVVAAFGISAGMWGWERSFGADFAALARGVGLDSADELARRSTDAGIRFLNFHGVHWVGIWILVFPFVVPSSARRTLVGSLLAVLTVPLVVLSSLAAHGASEAIRSWVPGLFSDLMVPLAICLGLATYGSHIVYRLTRDLSKAQELGSYRLVERIGAGGMGEVWRAEHRMLVRPAAIKLIRPDSLGARGGEDTETVLRRFEREAQATAALQSPNTVEIYDFGITDDGTFYYVMELLNGMDLKTLVETHGPVPPARAVFLLRQVCHSLWDAHEGGLIHRDIKPANIFACRRGRDYDFVKVLDFGLVKEIDGSADPRVQLTVEGVTSGTPGFMAPEVAFAERKVDARADIYSLGCVAYWLLTGHLVFEGETPTAMILRHVRDNPVPPSMRSELEIPPELDRVVLDCLEKIPENRPQTAVELSDRLAGCSTRTGDWTPAQAQAWWALHAPAAAS